MTERFEFPFKENYVEVDGVRLHYVDEGTGPVVLMFHGQPTWSYLYRKMIPPLVDAGYRCLVPDLMGFGLSAILYEPAIGRQARLTPSQVNLKAF